MRAVLLLTLVCAPGCSFLVRGNACSSDDDCGDGSTCVSGVCFEAGARAEPGAEDGGGTAAGEDARRDSATDASADVTPAGDVADTVRDVADAGSPQLPKEDASPPSDAGPPEADVPSPDACLDGDDDGADCHEDCDDDDPNRHPGAPELCNGVDDDCDEDVDPGCPEPRPGWPVQLRGRAGSSSPAIAVLGPQATPHVLVSTVDALHVVGPDGADVGSWPAVEAGVEWTSPVVAALDPLLAPAARVVLVGRRNSFVALGWDGADPAVFSVALSVDLEAVAVARDVLGDGRLEVLVPLAEAGVAVIESDGGQRGAPWPFPAARVASPAVADVEETGRSQLVLADTGGRLHVVGEGGPDASRSVAVSDHPLGPPSVADVDGDGALEVVVADAAGVVHSRHRGDGADWRVDLGGPLVPGVALAVVPDLPGAVTALADRQGRLHLLDPAGQEVPRWPFDLRADACGAPLLADVTGDGRPEVLAATADGRVHALELAAVQSRGFPLDLGTPQCARLAVGDLDVDGRADVVAVADDGELHAWQLDQGTWAPGLPAWPMARHDPARTGALP